MPFKFEGYEEPNQSKGFVFEGYEKEKPASLKGSAQSYASGAAGGAGGLLPDIARIVKPLSGFSQTAQSANQLADVLGLKTTPELTESIGSKIGYEGPENSLERILQQSGEFGGQEALFGTALGGPVGSALGLAHGSASGALYGGLKEAGLGDEWALALTALATLSPIAAQKLASRMASKLKSGMPVSEIAKESESALVQQSKSLKGRVSEKGKDTGIRPIPSKEINPLIEDIGRSISPHRFKNTSEGGRAIMKEIQTQDKSAYEAVNKAYQESRQANKGIEDIHPDLSDWMSSKIKDLKEIPDPSTIEKDLMKSLENLRSRLVTVDSIGNITGYRPINNQVLIDQVQSLRRKNIDYNFAHGDAKNIFRPYIEQVQSAARKAASSDEKALKTFDEARSKYRDWSQKFDNDYIRPFRDVSNRDFSKMYKSSQNIDEARALGEILNNTSSGSKINKGLLRDLTESKLEPFVEDLSKLDSRKFESSLRELEDILPESDLSKIRENVASHAKRSNIRAQPINIGEKIKITDLASLLKTAAKFAINPTSAAAELLVKIQNPKNISKLRRVAEGVPQKEMTAQETEKVFKKISKDLD